jgi:hypothetical protein
MACNRPKFAFDHRVGIIPIVSSSMSRFAEFADPGKPMPTQVKPEIPSHEEEGVAANNP